MVLRILITIGILSSLITGGFGSNSNGTVNYDKYKLLRTKPLTSQQAFYLQNLEDDFDFWQPIKSGLSTDIMFGPNQYDNLLNQLKNQEINFDIIMSDIGSLIKSQRIETQNRKSDRNFQQAKLTFDSYYSHNELNEYIDNLATQFSYVNTVSIGQSYENRDMRVIQISKAGSGAPNVFIEAGIHAREWISPAMATYLIDSLLNNDADGFKDNLNFHILISANPDGYEYSRNSDRMWRKTRSDTGSSCKGVDGNRNWDYKWGGTGSSGSTCSDAYRGPQPFSEVEMRNIRDYVLALNPVPILAMNLHSYGQYYLWPYGYAFGTNYPDNYEEIRDLAEEAVAALKSVHGTVYQPINSAGLYPAAGVSDDWYKGVLKSRFAYCVELRDNGNYGFLLPPQQIQSTGEELWAAQRVVFQKMVDLSNDATTPTAQPPTTQPPTTQPPTTQPPTMQPPSTQPPTTQPPTTQPPSGCASPQWSNDDYCDDENNNASCNYDGGACCDNSASGWNNYCSACECLEITTATATTTTATTPAPCQDKWKTKKCNKRKNKGHCSKKKVKKNCKKTCEVC